MELDFRLACRFFQQQRTFCPFSGMPKAIESVNVDHPLFLLRGIQHEVWKDRAMVVYLLGHGNKGTGSIHTSYGREDLQDFSPEYFFQTYKKLVQEGNLRSRHVLVIVDACHAGNWLGEAAIIGDDLKQQNCTVAVQTASVKTPSWGGVFTHLWVAYQSATEEQKRQLLELFKARPDEQNTQEVGFYCSGVGPYHFNFLAAGLTLSSRLPSFLAPSPRNYVPLEQAQQILWSWDTKLPKRVIIVDFKLKTLENGTPELFVAIKYVVDCQVHRYILHCHFQQSRDQWPGLPSALRLFDAHVIGENSWEEEKEDNRPSYVAYYTPQIHKHIVAFIYSATSKQGYFFTRRNWPRGNHRSFYDYFRNRSYALQTYSKTFK